MFARRCIAVVREFEIIRCRVCLIFGTSCLARYDWLLNFEGDILYAVNSYYHEMISIYVINVSCISNSQFNTIYCFIYDTRIGIEWVNAYLIVGNVK